MAALEAASCSVGARMSREMPLLTRKFMCMAASAHLCDTFAALVEQAHQASCHSKWQACKTRSAELFTPC